MTNKPKSSPTSSLSGDIPAEFMAKLQAAYQAAEPSSTQGCPEPEIVMGYAMEELVPEKRAQIYSHLLECKDCLDLVLDLQSAWAEAQERSPRVHEVLESTPIGLQAQSWLAGLVDGVRESLSRLIAVPRLIPAAAALLVLAVVGVGVFQHLTPTTSSQSSILMTNSKPGSTNSYQVCVLDKANKVSPGAPIMARNKVSLTFLPLLLENDEGVKSRSLKKEL